MAHEPSVVSANTWHTVVAFTTISTPSPRPKGLETPVNRASTREVWEGTLHKPDDKTFDILSQGILLEPLTLIGRGGEMVETAAGGIKGF